MYESYPGKEMATKKINRTLKQNTKEMRELQPKKDLAYIDASDNVGVDYLWDEFRAYRDKWNELAAERRKLLKAMKGE